MYLALAAAKQPFVGFVKDADELDKALPPDASLVILFENNKLVGVWEKWTQPREITSTSAFAPPEKHT